MATELIRRHFVAPTELGRRLFLVIQCWTDEPGGGEIRAIRNAVSEERTPARSTWCSTCGNVNAVMTVFSQWALVVGARGGGQVARCYYYYYYTHTHTHTQIDTICQ